MNTHADKTKTNDSKAIANEKAGKSSALALTNNRPEAAVQRKMAELAANGKGPVQLARQEYKTVATKPAGFNKSSWPAALSAGGQKADSSIASNVNQTLADMGWGGKVNLMSAHMIPKRLGGKGNNSNVRPWPDSFESGTWENNMEAAFDNQLDNLNTGDSLQYKVITDNLEEQEAKQVLLDAGYLQTDPTFTMHKDRLKKIPKEVEGVIGGMSIGATDECWPIK